MGGVKGLQESTWKINSKQEIYPKFKQSLFFPFLTCNIGIRWPTGIYKTCFMCMVKGREMAGCSRRMGIKNMEHNQKWVEQRAALQGADPCLENTHLSRPSSHQCVSSPTSLITRAQSSSFHQLIKDKLSYREKFFIFLPCSYFLLLMPKNEAKQG